MGLLSIHNHSHNHDQLGWDRPFDNDNPSDESCAILSNPNKLEVHQEYLCGHMIPGDDVAGVNIDVGCDAAVWL